MSYFSAKELEQLGFKSLGRDVSISTKASLYGVARISIGSHVRIDDFCILSAGEGGIGIGSFVHIACYCSLIGKERIQLEDFTGLSSRVSIYSSSDDYSGAAMTNPTVPNEFTAVQHGPVTLQKHAIVGSGTVILPGVVLGQGSAVGALSLVAKDCQPFTIYSGVPARRVGERKQALLELEKRLLAKLDFPSASDSSPPIAPLDSTGT
jgi:acetyltransferase-like isoleucine patch superfamily enzyme